MNQPERQVYHNVASSMQEDLIKKLKSKKEFTDKKFLPESKDCHFIRYSFVYAGEKVSIVFDTKAEMLTVTAFNDAITTIDSIFAVIKSKFEKKKIKSEKKTRSASEKTFYETGNLAVEGSKSRRSKTSGVAKKLNTYASKERPSEGAGDKYYVAYNFSDIQRARMNGATNITTKSPQLESKTLNQRSDNSLPIARETGPRQSEPKPPAQSEPQTAKQAQTKHNNQNQSKQNNQPSMGKSNSEQGQSRQPNPEQGQSRSSNQPNQGRSNSEQASARPSQSNQGRSNSEQSRQSNPEQGQSRSSNQPNQGRSNSEQGQSRPNQSNQGRSNSEQASARPNQSNQGRSNSEQGQSRPNQPNQGRSNSEQSRQSNPEQGQSRPNQPNQGRSNSEQISARANQPNQGRSNGIEQGLLRPNNQPTQARSSSREPSQERQSSQSNQVGANSTNKSQISKSQNQQVSASNDLKGKLNQNAESSVVDALEYRDGYSVKKLNAEVVKAIIQEIRERFGANMQEVSTVKGSAGDIVTYSIENASRQKVYLRNIVKKDMLQLQGKQSVIFSEIQKLISRNDEPKKAAKKNDKQPKNLYKEVKKALPYAFDYLTEQSKIDFTIGLIDINSDEVRLSDYSVLLVPPYRGLERLLFDLQKAKNIEVKMIGQAYEKDNGNYTLKAGYRKKIDSNVYNEVMSALYTEYFERRNFYAHSNNTDELSVRVISDKAQAKSVFENLISLINYNCKKLKEIGFTTKQ